MRARIVRNVTTTSAAIERGGVGQVERAVAEVRVRVGVEHDREEAVVDRARRRSSTRKCGSLAVVAAGPRRQRGRDEQRMAEPALPRRPLLDRLDDGGVVADARVEAEEATVDPAQADRAEVAGVDAVGEVLGGGDGIVGQPDRAGEDVGRPARQHAERGVAAGDAGRHLVERAVAPEADRRRRRRAGRRRGRSGWRGRAGSSRRSRRRGPGSAAGARRPCCGP